MHSNTPPASRVRQINEAGLLKLIKPAGRPLIVNFWATWCDPCREEFPDLVRLDNDYRGKIDFRTVSLDDLAEINRDVPKFLSLMKAQMPAFLLHAASESDAISLVSADWMGGLPFTIVFDAGGAVAYSRQGKIELVKVRATLDELLAPRPAAQ